MMLTPLGDAAVLLEVGDTIDAATHARVVAIVDALDSASVPGITDIVPAYTGVAVHYDVAAFGERGVNAFEHVCDAIRACIDAPRAAPAAIPARTVEIAVNYGGEFGPDLENVARLCALSPADVIRLHTGAEYIVYMIGFTPGFAYLAGLPQELAAPRHTVPRTAVPAGSVGIAGQQTGVYPLESPGGWQIIGRTAERLFRPEQNPPTLLRLGDRVRFTAVA